MNPIEYAMYRTARKLMDKEQIAIAVELARMADQGDKEAREMLRQMVMEILFNHKGRKGKHVS